MQEKRARLILRAKAHPAVGMAFIQTQGRFGCMFKSLLE